MKYTRACLVAPRKFGFFEVDEEPGEGQVLLKIASCGLCNWELNFWDGNMKIGEYPMKLGHEFAGEVVKLGPGVKVHLAEPTMNDDLDPNYQPPVKE